jgi:hypothetical protein
MKHKFEPRYDEQANPRFTGGEGFTANEVRRFLILDKYVHDICIWCGEIKKEANDG